MKHYLAVLVLSLMSSALLAQRHGDHLNAGLGFDSNGLPIYGSMDFGFRGDFNLGVGASLAIGGDNGGALGLGGFTQWYADDLLEIPDDFDTYAGGGLFLYLDDGTDLDLNLFIGGRYYFDPKIAINLELGGGTVRSGGRIGVSWRF